MKSTVVLAWVDSYHGLPSLPKNAQMWTIVINSLNDGYAYNFTVTRPKEIIYSRSEHAELRAAFALTMLVALRRFMLGESRRMQGANIPVHIAIKFGDGPFFDMSTAFKVEDENFPLFLHPGPSTTQPSHDFIDMAASSLKIELPSPKSSPRTKPIDGDSDLSNDRVGPRSLSTIPLDKEAYYSVSSDSPLFDACATANSRGSAVSTALVIAHNASKEIGTSLREKGIHVTLLRHRDTDNDPQMELGGFRYSGTGEYEFDEHYDVAYIDMPSSKKLTIDTYQKCKLAAHLRDSGTVKGSIMILVGSMLIEKGKYDILDIPGHTGTSKDTIVHLRSSFNDSLYSEEPLKCLIIGTISVAKGENLRRVTLARHPIFASFLDELALGLFLCDDNQWNHVLLGQSYLLANVLRSSFEHVLLAENPLQCYAALKVGAPSQFSTSFQRKFMSDSVDHIDVLPSAFFFHNPRFIEMVSARYDELKAFCHDTTADVPEKITSLFFSPPATVLLQSLMGFRNSLNEFDPYDEERGYHRVVPFEAMAILCSKFIGNSTSVWKFQDFLCRPTAFGTWQEKRWYMTLKFGKLLDGTADEEEI
ncbi:uncharacterized protein EAE97_009574 [Botrytis byssoidea]|uniref:Uncharacterized protein n=1 Tax=Botrytis byssoidea TaxID=139641 RepID=A0A9P5I8Q6_9HELO|nr:uncharacterized protein EAE97_009574 [Botrytis byssoidea]KAF7929977.1 hypothetical protein EAE97_009574 [Botrytis byssoidea]